MCFELISNQKYVSINYIFNIRRRRVLKEKTYSCFNKDCTVEEIFTTDRTDVYNMIQRLKI